MFSIPSLSFTVKYCLKASGKGAPSSLRKCLFLYICKFLLLTIFREMEPILASSRSTWRLLREPCCCGVCYEHRCRGKRELDVSGISVFGAGRTVEPLKSPASGAHKSLHMDLTVWGVMGTRPTAHCS